MLCYMMILSIGTILEVELGLRMSCTALHDVRFRCAAGNSDLFVCVS